MVVGRARAMKGFVDKNVNTHGLPAPIPSRLDCDVPGGKNGAFQDPRRMRVAADHDPSDAPEI
jgi:hypothetical protein